MTTSDITTSQQCAHCDGPLPAPVEALAVVHGADGAMLTTCSTTCLAELVAILVGRPAEAGRHGEGRRN